jgi:hypothetical protein
LVLQADFSPRGFILGPAAPPPQNPIPAHHFRGLPDLPGFFGGNYNNRNIKTLGNKILDFSMGLNLFSRQNIFIVAREKRAVTAYYSYLSLSIFLAAILSEMSAAINNFVFFSHKILLDLWVLINYVDKVINLEKKIKKKKQS